MLKTVFKYASLIATAATSLCVADCQTTFEMGIGYRRDFTSWNTNVVDILGNEISSKLRFKDQDIVTLSAKTKMIEDWFYFRAQGDYGWILSGKVENSFKIDPLVGDEFKVKFRDKMKKSGNVADVVAAVGYPFEFCCGDFVLAPVVGYAYHYQRIKRDSNLPSDVVFPVIVAPFEANGLRHTTRWYGPLLGADVFWRLDDCWNIWGEFQYVFAKCKRTFENNTGVLEFDFDHHSRSRKAWGFDASIGSDYFFTCNWYAGLSVDFKYYGSSRSAKDIEPVSIPPVSFEDGRIGDKVRWNSVGINLNLGYLF